MLFLCRAKYGIVRFCDVKYSEESIQRKRWVVDANIPIFKGEGREYINERLLLPPEQIGVEE